MKQNAVRALGLFCSLIIMSACGTSGSSSSTQKKYSEFSAFNPKTGLPITVQDLNASMFQADMTGDGDEPITPQDIVDVSVPLQTASDSLLLGWTPTGEYNSYLSADCHYDKLKSIMDSSQGKTSDLANAIQNWQVGCDDQLSRGKTSNILDLLQFDNVKYGLTKNSNIKKINFTFDNSTVLRGFIAMKPGKHPLVIFKEGITDDAEDGSVARNFFMNMYDESPFNILVIGSNTGEEYIKDNHVLTMGGFEEGQQIVKISQMLMADSNYKDNITDIHVVGVSLGSNGALFSSLYNSAQPDSTSKIKSVMAFCPVVNLQPTMLSIFKDTPRGIFYGFLLKSELQDVYSSVPDLKNYLNIGDSWSRAQMYTASTMTALDFYKTQTEATPWDMSPFLGDQIHTLDDFWAHNNFTGYAGQITTPTLVVYAKDDPMVKPSINSENLLAVTQNNNSDIGVLAFNNGSHCAFNVGESWPTVSTLIRSFVLKHSAYQSDTMNDQTIPYSGQVFSMSGTQKIAKYAFAAQSHKSTIDLSISYFDSQADYNCRSQDPLNAADYCYVQKKVALNLTNFSSSGIVAAQNDFEAERLTRWFNTHISLLDSTAAQILGGHKWPNQILIHGMYEQAAE